MAATTEAESRSTTRAVVVFLAALAPALAAVWAVPGFVTQDGPAHLYNAHILTRSFDPDSPFRAYYEVRWEPLPNWAGHLALMGLVEILPPRAADRAMTSLTLVGLAASTLWLRRRVSGERGLAVAGVASVVLGLNVAWLLGFTSFLLGASLFPVTLGVWWSGRDEGYSRCRALGLAALVVLGYFCHLVSLGLTALALGVLELATPGAHRRGRAATTALGLLPLGPLGALYLSLMRRGGGGLAPEWKHLAGVWPPRAWLPQLSWVDPVTIVRRDVLPFVEGFSSPACALATPVVLLAAGFGLTLIRRSQHDPARRGWWLAAAVLVALGAAGPDTLGASHGEYLQQRVVLLGLVAGLVVLPLERAGHVGTALIGLAWLVQVGFVWDYALTSNRTAGAVLRAGEAVGRGQRVATQLSQIRTRFRANPLLHADCALGVATGNIVWANYETRFYYFPVHFRDGLDHPDAFAFEQIALLEAPADADQRAERWAALLDEHHDAIDVVLAWGEDPALDAITSRRYAEAYADGPVRVYRKRQD